MKKFINKVKRGFTLVELAIVIAVIAILIAVLVPTFIALIDSANESKDTQMIYNVNQALSIENENINTVSDALDVAAEAGYNIDKLTPSSDGEIVYDHATKSFALISTEGEVIYPTSNSSLDLNAPTTYYFVDEATYTALNTTTSDSSVSYSLAKTTVKSATDGETAGGTTQKEHTASYVATGEWTGAFEYTGMGAIDTTRAKGITSVSYTSQTVENDKDYKLNVAYYIAESSVAGYSLTVNITESVDTIYTSVASNVVYNISVAENCTVNIVEANENAAPMLYTANANVSLTVSINGTDVTEDYTVEKNENAVVENGALQLGTEKYPWLIASESDLTKKIAYGGYCKVASAEVTSTTALTVTAEAILDLNGCTLTITGASNSSHIINSGTLTITDSSTAKTGKLVVNTTTYGITNNGTLTIEGGTITGKTVIYMNSTSASLYMTGGTIESTTYGVWSKSSLNTIITGGKVSQTGSSSYPAILVNPCSGTAAISDVTITSNMYGINLTAYGNDVTIENVTISGVSSDGISVGNYGTGTVYIKNCTVSSSGCALMLDGNVVVEGGTYTGAGNVTTNGKTVYYALYISGTGVELKDGTFNGGIRVDGSNSLTVSGGTFDGSFYIKSSKGVLTITGGTFTNTFTDLANSGTLNIYGGKFEEDPTNYVDTQKYDVSEKTNNYYTVTAKS